MTMKHCSSGVLLLLMAVSAAPAFSLDERITIRSRTVSDEDFLRGDDASSPDVTLTGQLSGGAGAEKLPVVILLHGTDGPTSGSAASWRYYLDTIGIATLRLDSYTGRGLSNASGSQGSFGQFTQIYDAYRAVEVLGADPRIDPSRIVVMGFSRGGTAALYAAMTRFQKSFGPRGARIAAFLSFYPACNFALETELEVDDVPIREFHGADDDWTPAAPCRDYLARLKASGADAVMTEYPGALHGFDNVGNPAYVTFPDFQTSRNCFRREVDRRLVNAATGAPFSYSDACVEYGPSTRYDDRAATEARAAVKSQLARLPTRK